MKKILAGLFLVLGSMVFLQMGCNLAATPTQTGNPTLSAAWLSSVIALTDDPWGVSIDSAGNIYYSTNNNPGEVVKVTPAGVATTVVSGISYSRAVAVDTDGTIYYSSRYPGRIIKVSTGGVSTTLNNTNIRGRISGLTVRNGKVYYSQAKYDQVGYVPTSGGTPVLIPSGPGFSRPKDLAFDGAGNLYIANSSSGEILKYDGTSTTLFASGLSTPVGIAVDNSGNVYVSEKGSGNIQKFTPAGVQSFVSGGFCNPRAITYANYGLLLADSCNDRVVRLADPVWK